MSNGSRLLFLSSAAFAFCASAAAAADLDAIGYQPESGQPVEVGSGWYLRGDVGYNVSSRVKLYAETPDGSFSETDDMQRRFSPSVGVGYQFTDNLRGDVTASYLRQSLEDAPIEARSWDVMANGYVDLGNYSGFTPYVGAGLGVANVRYTVDTDLGQYKSEGDYRFAWALMAGVSIDVASNVKLDLGYRYGVIDGGEIVSGNGVTVGDRNLRNHQLRAGVRLTTW